MNRIWPSLLLLACAGCAEAQRLTPPTPPTPATPATPAIPAVPAVPPVPAVPAVPPVPPVPPLTDGRLYTPGPFDRVEIDGSAKVRLIQDERDQVFISGDDTVQQGVEIEVRNKRLTIHPGGGWKFWAGNRRLQVEVRMRELSQLTLSGATDLVSVGPIRADQLVISISGAGQVRMDELNAGTLSFDVSGAGDGQLAGQVKALRLSISGKGKLIADSLRANSASVSISGVGNAHLWVTDALRVSISGVGSVDYWGEPQVKKSTEGLGSVNARGDKK